MTGEGMPGGLPEPQKPPNEGSQLRTTEQIIAEARARRAQRETQDGTEQPPMRGRENVLDKFSQVVAGNRLGREIKETGQTVKLADVFGDNLQEAAKIVFLRTRSGNIYQLTREGDSLKLMSAKDIAANRGRGVGAENYLDLKKELADENKIVVGESFLWNHQSTNTSTILEAVIVDPQIINDPNLLAKYPVNKIVEDFSRIATPAKKQELSPTEYLQVSAESTASENHPDRNEDSFFVLPNKKACGVFDGLGGHAAGNKASGLARDAVEKSLGSLSDGLTLEQAREAVEKTLLNASAEVFDQAQKDHNNMATTGSVVYIWEGKAEEKKAVIGNVGDSRVYLFRRGKLEQITLDDNQIRRQILNEAEARQIQSKLNNATSAEQLSKSERDFFNSRNIISQTLGSYRSVSPRLHVVDFMPGDMILACSDGISDNLTDNQIGEILLYSSSSDLALKNLVKEALKTSRDDRSNIRSKPDDMTAIVINSPIPGRK